jgi:hypothetical protein
MAKDQSLETRVERLERQARQWRAAALGLVAVLVYGAWRRADVVTAESFVLADSEGKMKADFRTNEGEPALRLYNKDGKEVLALLVNKGEPMLSLADARTEKDRAILHANPDGNAALVLFQPGSNEVQSSFGIHPSEGGSAAVLSMSDAATKARFGVQVTEKAGPMLRMTDRKGAVVARVPR